MKVSQLIETLKNMQDTYGDLVVNLSFGMPPDKNNISVHDLYFRHEKYAKDGKNKAHEEISISSFPY
jgi:hypothetical protein